MTIVVSLSFFFFFFKQKTAYEMRISDWSSDVCSSDLCVCWRPMSYCGCPASAPRVRLRSAYAAGARPTKTFPRRCVLAASGKGDVAVTDEGAAGDAFPGTRFLPRSADYGHPVFLSRPHEIGRASCRERVCQYV